MSDKAQAEQLAVYAERLLAYDARDVAKGCRFWSGQSQFWPAWHELAGAVGQAREERQTAERPRIMPPRRREDARRRQPTTDPDEIRETCKLLEAIRAQPHKFIAPAALLRWGELLIARHIVAGRAPSDVAEWYRDLPARYRDQLEAERGSGA